MRNVLVGSRFFFVFLLSVFSMQDLFSRYGMEELCRRIAGLELAMVEKTAADPKRTVFYQQRGGSVVLTPPHAKTAFVAGDFREESVAELTEKLNRRPVGEGIGRVNAVIGYGFQHLSGEQKDTLDLASLQREEANDGAVFQLITMTDSSPIASIDSEAASLSQRLVLGTAPGFLYRRYGRIAPIDLTAGIDAFVGCRRDASGISFSKKYVRRMASEFDYRQMKMGIHLETEVVDPVTGARLNVETNGHQSIIQVCTALLRDELSLISRRCRDLDPSEVFAINSLRRGLIRAACEGVLLAAAVYGEQHIEKGLQKVFLMLPEAPTSDEFFWFLEVLKDKIDLIVKYDLDVTLIIPDVAAGDGLAAYLDGLRKVIKVTKGDVVVVEPVRQGSSQRKPRR